MQRKGKCSIRVSELASVDESHETSQKVMNHSQ